MIFKNRGWSITIVSILFLCCFTFAFSITNASLVYDTNAQIDYFLYEEVNSTTNNSLLFYGTNSYHDFSILNKNTLLTICDDNLTLNQKLDLRYYSESYNITQSVLNYAPLVLSRKNTSTGVGNQSTWCTTVDVRLASTLALYPGYLSVYLDNSLFYPSLNQPLNGSYDIGVTVKSTPKRYLFNTAAAYGQNESVIIEANEEYLLTSLLSKNNTVLAEDRLSRSTQLVYYDELVGGEKVIVNGILSLEILIYNPCDIINESGYYILNNTNTSSIRNISETCVRIENISNVVLNFGDDYIDGDNATNGSLSPGTCPVIVQNARNITFEHFQTQEFYYGVCIINSTVNVFGDGTTYNVIGAYVTDDSIVEFEDISFENEQSEIQAFNDSRITLRNVNLATASLNSNFYNAIFKSVRDEPPLPAPDANGTDIDQFVEVNPTQSGSWAQINFIYPEPLPNGLAIDDVSILKYNGTYEERNISTTTLINGSNVTTYNLTFGWGDGNWTQLFTLVSPQTKEIIAPNQTTFSVFAPFAYVINNTNPEPVPTPKPKPDPSSGPSGGSGSGGAGGGSGGEPLNSNNDLSVLAEAIELNLTFAGPLTLEQGQPLLIPFTLNNTGVVSATDITIVPRIPDDWETVNASIAELLGNSSIEDGLLIAPHEKAVAREYKIPVDVYVFNGSAKVATEILTIKVIPAKDLRRLRVIEYPPVIQMAPNEEMNISFLVANVGSNDLVDVSLQFSENDCLRNINGINSILKGETKLFKYDFFSGQPDNCDVELTFYEDKTLVGFVPITLIVQPAIGINTREKSYILLLLLGIWTIITFIVITRKRQKTVGSKEDTVHEL